MDEYKKSIIDYIRKNIKKGYTVESLRWALIGQGYSRSSVDRSIEEFNRELAREAPVLKESPMIKHEIVEPNVAYLSKPWWKKILFWMD